MEGHKASRGGDNGRPITSCDSAHFYFWPFRPEGDSPDAIVNFLEADICADIDVRDVAPLMVPPDATVGADVAPREAVRVLKRCQFIRHLPEGGFIAGGGCTHVERLVRPFWCGLPCSMNSGRMPRRTHRADNWDSRARVLVANGTPLSVRMRCGRPNPLDTRVETGLAFYTRVEGTAWHASRKRL
jgi:hypothetical protein